MNSNTKRELEARIAAFAEDITEILARAMADAVAGSVGRTRGRGVKGAARGRGGRGRGGAGIDEDVLLREVQKKAGRRMEELSQALNTPSDRIIPTMRRLLAAKKVKKTGNARGTKYTAA